MKSNSIVVVANAGDSSISIIDPYILKEVQRIKLFANTGPYDLLNWDPKHHIIMSQCYNDTLAYVDLINGKVLDTIVLGRRPCYIAHDTKSNMLFITNSDSDTISIVNGQKMTLEGQMRVGSMPQGIDCNVGMRTIAVANVNSNDVWIIDSDNFQIKKIIKLNQCPLHIKYSVDGKYLYVGCSCPNSDISGCLIILDTLKYNIQCKIQLRGLPGQLYDTRCGKYIIVTSMSKGGLDILDIHKGKVIKKLKTNGMTQGIAVDYEEEYVYVTNTDENSVSVVDWRRGKTVAEIKVGKEPNGIIFI
ncbi:MAG TPA: hypothetical protein VFD57_04520 [Clostridia bacterium]|nr:hypothetical protein [Clostridia bacterium]